MALLVLSVSVFDLHTDGQMDGKMLPKVLSLCCAVDIKDMQLFQAQDNVYKSW